jgi:hypothetical protein
MQLIPGVFYEQQDAIFSLDASNFEEKRIRINPVSRPRGVCSCTLLPPFLTKTARCLKPL